MSEDRLKILRMLQDKKITVDEAERCWPRWPVWRPPSAPPSRLRRPDCRPTGRGSPQPARSVPPVPRAARRSRPVVPGLKSVPPLPPVPPGVRVERRKRGRQFTTGWDIRTSELLAALQDAGCPEPSDGDLEEMRAHGVEPDYIRAMAATGLTGLRVKDLIELRIHDVDPDYVRAIREHYPDVRLRDLREFAIHDIQRITSPGCIGVPNLDARDIREFGLQTSAGVRGPHARAAADLDAARHREFGLHDIRPELCGPDARAAARPGRRDVREFGMHDIRPE